MAMAGGVASLVSCGGGAAGPVTGPPIPCGNGSPDPCICGRPDASATAAAECAAENACQGRGGTWWSVTGPGAPDGIRTPHCEEDGGVDGTDDANRSD